MWKEADRLAEGGAWRDAVHAVYWAASARLATTLRWPRDVTRTPRESLRLLDPASELRADFTSLTRTFEQTWYGRRAARAEDFKRARVLFDRLGSQR